MHKKKGMTPEEALELFERLPAADVTIDDSESSASELECGEGEEEPSDRDVDDDEEEGEPKGTRPSSPQPGPSSAVVLSAKEYFPPLLQSTSTEQEPVPKRPRRASFRKQSAATSEKFTPPVSSPSSSEGEGTDTEYEPPSSSRPKRLSTTRLRMEQSHYLRRFSVRHCSGRWWHLQRTLKRPTQKLQICASPTIFVK